TFSKPWLLIFDNVEENVARPEKGGCVLITARRKVNLSIQSPQYIELPPFSEEEALFYLKQYRFSASEANQKRLIVKLEFLPLAVTKAAAYIDEEDITIESYLKALEDPSLVEPQEREAKTIIGALRLTWRKVCSKLPFIEEFLKFALQTIPGIISEEILQQWL